MEFTINRRDGSEFTVLVDDADAEAVMKHRWHVVPMSHYHYVRSTKVGYLHHFLTGSKDTDHVNRNALDNRRENLRIATRGQQCANRRARSDRSSRFKGVVPPGGDGSKRWGAAIKVNGVKRTLGRHDTEEEAARAYDAAAQEAWGEFALLNFP